MFCSVNMLGLNIGSVFYSLLYVSDFHTIALVALGSERRMWSCLIKKKPIDSIFFVISNLYIINDEVYYVTVKIEVIKIISDDVF